jgi:hypothetical protein
MLVYAWFSPLECDHEITGVLRNQSRLLVTAVSSQVTHDTCHVHEKASGQPCQCADVFVEISVNVTNVKLSPHVLL